MNLPQQYLRASAASQQHKLTSDIIADLNLAPAIRQRSSGDGDWRRIAQPSNLGELDGPRTGEQQPAQRRSPECRARPILLLVDATDDLG
jgi:hypothetical protein